MMGLVQHNNSTILVHPATVTFVVIILLVAWVTSQAGGDPLALARLGTKYSQGDVNGSEGYDGQFVYYIAQNPDPSIVAAHLDVPSYRYQRILMPILARWLSLGREDAIPWILAGIGIFAQTIGTLLFAELLAGWGVNRWYALVYGLWAGFTLAVRLDLPEPLAYALVVGALLAHDRQRDWLSWFLYGLAVFTKEVVILFVAAALVSCVLNRRWKDVGGLVLLSIFPYAIFQFWLWSVFGQPGLGSGGSMATPFEVIPLMGLLRIGYYSVWYLIAMLVVFGPSIIFPAMWGVWASVKKWRSGELSEVIWPLTLNSLIIFFLPFSTFRETGGLLRFACGLVMSVLIFAARYRLKKVLNYSQFWLVFNVFLLKS
jgi:hypothetical protein